jgi:site-specific recombinase XerD
LRFLSSFFEYMVDDEYINKNPIKGIGRILIEKRIKKAFTAEDLARIRDSCRTLRDRALVEFLYSTGCRVSECTALQVKDIDFRADELIVFGKGHKERVCYLNKTAKNYLREYLRSREASLDAPLFCHTRVDARLTPRAVELILKDIGQKAGVENVHPHRFRRTFATDLWKAGVPVETIRILMGHTNIATTLRYIDIDPCGVKQAFARAQKVISGKK